MNRSGDRQNLTITLLHRLPGRIRIELSSPPRDWDRMAKAVSSHKGITRLTYSPVCRTVLLEYDSRYISQEEFLIRLAVLLSADYDMQPVVFSEPVTKEKISAAAYVSVGLILGSLVSGIIPRLSRYKRILTFLASAGTVAAVVDHGYREYKAQGSFDPEVLSVIYLVTSLVRGAGVTAPIITWLASFGRHLFGAREKSLLVKPVPIPGGDASKPTFEVSIRELNPKKGIASIFRMVPQILAEAVSGGTFGKDRLIDQIRDVSSAHDSVLEGFGNYKKGISLIIN